MPSPRPAKIAPLTMPRREGGTCASTDGAAVTINTPPANPEAKRHPKNQTNEMGQAQAKKAKTATSIIVRTSLTLDTCRASTRAPKAPAR